MFHGYVKLPEGKSANQLLLIFLRNLWSNKKTLPFTTATHDISWHLPSPAPKRPQVTSSSVGALRVVPNRMTLCLGEPFTKDFIIGQGTWRPRLIPVRVFCKNHPGDIQKSMLNCTKYPVKYIVIPGGSSWKISWDDEKIMEYLHLLEKPQSQRTPRSYNHFSPWPFLASFNLWKIWMKGPSVDTVKPIPNNLHLRCLGSPPGGRSSKGLGDNLGLGNVCIDGRLCRCHGEMKKKI